ncbi:two-component system, NtrC family, sensor histidine kinase AtoS [Methylococcales bacterium]|nr:two-component system, NtrC family, sensor histidine kinase AtoS [Methylococcales bacterium]
MTTSGELYLFNADNLRFCWLNQQAIQDLGYSRQQLLAMRVTDIYPEFTANTASFVEKLSPLLTRKLSELRFETLQQGKDLHPVRVMLKFELFNDDGRRFIHVQVENPKILESHQQQLQMTQFVMDNVSIAVYWLDQHGRVRYANRSACQTLGYSQQELLSLTVDAIDPLHPLNQWREHWQALKREGALVFESRHKTKNGRVFPVKVLANYLHVGDLEYNVAFARDISQTKQLEARLGSLLSVVNVIIWSANADGQIDYVSPQINEILGLPADDFVGMNLQGLIQSDRFHRRDRTRLLTGFRTLLKHGGSVRNLQYRIKNAGGQWQWMALSMSVILDCNQSIQQVVGATHDINLQKQEEAHLLNLNAELDQRVQQELVRNEKTNLLLQRQARLVAMGEMIGNIAHQWRQPLNALAIRLLNVEDALAHGEIHDGSVRQALGRSQEILSDMSRTIDEFRGFLKNEQFVSETVLAEVILNSLRLLQAAMDYHHIKLVFINPECALTATVNSGELSQALLCLINNAKEQILQRKIQNGEITISIEQPADWTEIRISDNAGGISEANLQKIFDPYFTTKPDGIGLGLYISNLTIQQTMNGRIEVKNCDDGAQFSIYLPKISAREHLL